MDNTIQIINIDDENQLNNIIEKPEFPERDLYYNKKSLDYHERAFKNVLKELKDYLKHIKIPKEERKRVEAFASMLDPSGSRVSEYNNVYDMVEDVEVRVKGKKIISKMLRMLKKEYKYLSRKLK
jgi:hypothetical protein